MDVVEILAGLGGAARARSIVEAGASSTMLARALEQGRVARVARGIYALPERDAGLLAALRAGTDLACISAVQRLGLWVLREPRLLHVSADHGRPIAGDGMRVHRAPLPLSTVAVCVQCCRCLPKLDALCIVESAVVLRRVRLADLREHTLGQRSGSLRTVLKLLDARAESILETVARYHLVQAGFHVASQVHVPGVGRIDLFVDGVLGIEADGRPYHSDRREFEEDRRRWNLLTTRGIPILRVTHDLLVRDPEQFIVLVRAAVAARATPMRSSARNGDRGLRHVTR
ncbi:type IV toxin-antitoxin system AbiEi family antitoxin domain-containing protein [Arthrobacter sp. MDT1-65]